MTDRRGVPWSVLWRALAVQGSWNYETLTGTGFGFAILPALRRLYPDPLALDDAVRRHERPFNSHPYLAPLALGAVIRLEQDGEDPEVIERFKMALRGSLGTIGDQLIWAGWRPICALAALALLLLGAPWYLVVLTFLALYNAGHLALMGWGLAIGFRDGKLVAERLRSSIVRRSQARLMAVGAFMTAFVVTLLLARGLPLMDGVADAVWLVAAVVAAAAGALWGERARNAAIAIVAFLVLGALAAGVVP